MKTYGVLKLMQQRQKLITTTQYDFMCLMNLEKS